MARPKGLWYKRAVPQTHDAGLVRAIGRWSLVALTINSVIGSGVFGLPSVVAGFAGSRSPLIVLAAGLVMAVIVSCFAEVASQFSQAGGPYLYARTALGRLMGIETAWMLWTSQVTAVAANANLFVIYVGQFWPQATQPAARIAILTALVWLLAAVNYRGVKAGTQFSNVFTVAKLLPLAVVIAGGALYALAHPSTASASASTLSGQSGLKAMLLLVFAYGGFETALAPMSEARNPRRDTVFALFMAIAVCTALYTTMQWIVMKALADPARSARPVADVAQLFLGRTGAGLIAVGALVSLYGYLSAKILANPRITFALAEEGDLPAWFGAVHPRFRTPHVSIVVFAGLCWAMAVAGSFASNVTLSAVGRLFYYAAGCAALLVLRRKPSADAFRMPGGRVLAVLGIVICVTLLAGVERSGSLFLAATVAAALLNWLWVRRRGARAA